MLAIGTLKLYMVSVIWSQTDRFLVMNPSYISFKIHTGVGVKVVNFYTYPQHFHSAEMKRRCRRRETGLFLSTISFELFRVAFLLKVKYATN